MLKHLAGRIARRLAPRSFARLEAVDRIGAEVAGLAARTAELQHALDQLADRSARLEERTGTAEARLHTAGDGVAELRGRLPEVGELRGRVDALGDELAESRRLSLRVAQLTDLVFDRLATTPGQRTG